MIGDFNCEKDGLSSLLLATIILSNLGISFSNYLNKIYRKYGWHLQYNSYYRGDNIKQVFEQVKARIKHIGYEHELVNANILTIKLPELTITLRASGTEPKLKFYSEQVFDYEEPDCVIKLRTRVQGILDELLQGLGLHLKAD